MWSQTALHWRPVRQLRRSWIWLLAAVALAWGLARIPPRFVYTADALMKYVQANSILAWGKTQPYYQLADVDPEYRFYPIKASNYLARMPDGSIQLVFSLAYAYVGAALLATVGRDLAPLSNCVLFVLYLLILRRIWRIDRATVALAIVGTPLLMQAVDFSEVMGALSLVAAGMGLALRSNAGAAFKDGAWGGLLLALSVALRLELLILAATTALLLAYRSRPGSHGSAARWQFVAFCSAAGVTLSLIGAWHFVEIGRPIGARWASPVEVDHVYSLSTQLDTALNMLVGDVKLGVYQPGFFGHLPAAVTLIAPFFLKTYRNRKLLLGSAAATLAFIAIAVSSAPHDGHWSWGSRYLLAALAPALLSLSALIKRLVAIRRRAGYRRTRSRFIAGALLALIASSGVYSAWQLARGMRIFGDAIQQMKTTGEICEATSADLAVFDNPLVAMHLGPCVLKFSAFLASDPDEARLLFPLLQQRYPGASVAYFHNPLLAAMASEGSARTRSPGDLSAWFASQLILIDQHQWTEAFLVVRRYRFAGAGDPRAQLKN